MSVTAELAPLAADLRDRLPDSTTEDASIAELSTYRVGGPVAVLVRAHDVTATRQVLDMVTGLRSGVPALARRALA